MFVPVRKPFRLDRFHELLVGMDVMPAGRSGGAARQPPRFIDRAASGPAFRQRGRSEVLQLKFGGEARGRPNFRMSLDQCALVPHAADPVVSEQGGIGKFCGLRREVFIQRSFSDRKERDWGAVQPLIRYRSYRRGRRGRLACIRNELRGGSSGPADVSAEISNMWRAEKGKGAPLPSEGAE